MTSGDREPGRGWEPKKNDGSQKKIKMMGAEKQRWEPKKKTLKA